MYCGDTYHCSDVAGGIVASGASAADLFMRDGDVFCYVSDRDGVMEEVRLDEDAKGQAAGMPMVSTAVPAAGPECVSHTRRASITSLHVPPLRWTS